MDIPADSQALIAKCKTGKIGALTRQLGYQWILDVTPFLPKQVPIQQRIWHIENNKLEGLVCPICQQKQLNWNRRTNQYKEVCSVQCAARSTTSKEKKKQTNLEKYGHENIAHGSIREKVIQTLQDRYGVDNSRKSDTIKEKILKSKQLLYGDNLEGIVEKTRQTMLDRYGVESTNQLDCVKEKKKQTCMENYGVDYPLQSDEIQLSKQQTDKERWIDQHYNQLHLTPDNARLLNNKAWLLSQHELHKRTLTAIASTLGCSQTTISRKFETNDWTIQRFPVSQAEREIQSFFTEYSIEYQSNVRNIIAPLELDLFLPEHNIAIEYCGLYWHCSKHPRMTQHTHKKKLDACIQQGIRLITIFEDEWIHNKELVKQKLLAILGKDQREKIFARKCKIVNVHNTIKTKFFDTNHIQGNGPGSINIGLEYNNELVACMTFIKQPEGVMNLNRYATSQQVVGGFSKLLNHFKKNYQWNQILSFADLRWSQGDLYQKNGFVLDKILPPDYEYVDLVKLTRIHKFNFRHKNLSNILGDMYDPTLSETQNTYRAGWYKIYNCGLMRYVITNT